MIKFINKTDLKLIGVKFINFIIVLNLKEFYKKIYHYFKNIQKKRRVVLNKRNVLYNFANL